ncbi:MAG TPA: hypothetical protein VFQ60_01525 [Patescibacteria group bacterium]|nr:hypothetical protein [Patescibacteria group bacterium]
MSRQLIRSRIIEMDWICAHCKFRNKGLSGKTGESVRCDNCGADKSVEKYLMPDETYSAPTITDPKLLERAMAGANWTCRFCRSDQRALHDHCQACGAPRYEERLKNPPESQSNSSAEHAVKAVEPADPGEAAANDGDLSVISPLTRRLRNPNAIVIGTGALGLTGMVIFLVWLFGSHEATARVEDNSWKYIESLQQKTLENGRGWDSDMPEDPFNVSCETRQKGTEPCHPHDCNCRDVSYECNCTGGDSYECNCTESESCSPNGNGSATCNHYRSCSTCYTPRSCSTCYRNECDTCYDECPVYAKWCTYQYYDWPEIQRKEERGNEMNVKWPGLKANGPGQRVIRKEFYSVQFTDGEHHWKMSPRSFDEYRNYPMQTRHRIEYSRAGQFRVLQHL